MASKRADVFASTPLLRSLPERLTICSFDGSVELDHDTLGRRVSGRAEEIRETLGDSSGQIVVSVSDPIEGLIDLFAVWASGNCAVLVSPELSDDEKTRVNAKVTPLLWATSVTLQSVEGTASKSPWPEAALILMTSGTTGDPKGVTHSLGSLEKRLHLNLSEIGAETLAQTLCPLPLYFGHGLIGNCLTALFAGGNLHLMKKPSLRDYAEFGATLDRLKISFLSSVPSMWHMVLRVSSPAAKPLERVHVGSAPLPLALWDQIIEWCGTDQVFNTYGMTETANWISGGLRPENGKEGFVGTPWGGRFRVLRDGALQAEGQGEVAVASPSSMLGLWGENAGQPMMDGYLLTGDIGDLAPNQSLRLIGRAKNEINVAGIKVLAEEVDMLLERHPDISEACAFAAPDEVSGERVGAAVCLHEDATAGEQDIIGWCKTQARPQAVPHRIDLLENLPKTDRGKLDRQTIQKQALVKWH